MNFEAACVVCRRAALTFAACVANFAALNFRRAYSTAAAAVLSISVRPTVVFRSTSLHHLCTAYIYFSVACAAHKPLASYSPAFSTCINLAFTRSTIAADNTRISCHANARFARVVKLSVSGHIKKSAARTSRTILARSSAASAVALNHEPVGPFKLLPLSLRAIPPLVPCAVQISTCNQCTNFASPRTHPLQTHHVHFCCHFRRFLVPPEPLLSMSPTACQHTFPHTPKLVPSVPGETAPTTYKLALQQPSPLVG